jgi:hypothetical protein
VFAASRHLRRGSLRELLHGRPAPIVVVLTAAAPEALVRLSHNLHRHKKDISYMINSFSLIHQSSTLESWQSKHLPSRSVRAAGGGAQGVA